MSGSQLYDQLGEALKAQRDRFGETAFANRRRVISLLADALPEARREIRAVSSALDEGAVEAMCSVERSLLGMEMDRQADRLEQSVGLRADLAKQVIRALAYGLGLGPPPSVYEAATPQPAPAAAGDWAGVSQPTMPAAPQHHAHAATHTQPTIAPPAQPAAPSKPLFTIQGFGVTKTHAIAAAGVVVAALFVMPMLNRGAPAAPAGPAGQREQVQNAEYAGELQDFGVQVKDTLESNVGSPTPLQAPGAQRVTTMEVRALAAANADVLLVDVLADPHQVTIQGAKYVPAAGQPGSFNDNAQRQTVAALRSITGGRTDRPLVFFCAGSACWESYNAVLRARAAGYTQLYWYRGGLASWNAAQLPFQQLPPPAS